MTKLFDFPPNHAWVGRRISGKRPSAPWEDTARHPAPFAPVSLQDVSLEALLDMDPPGLRETFPQAKARLRAMQTRLAHFVVATEHNLEAARGTRSFCHQPCPAWKPGPVHCQACRSVASFARHPTHVHNKCRATAPVPNAALCEWLVSFRYQAERVKTILEGL